MQNKGNDEVSMLSYILIHVKSSPVTGLECPEGPRKLRFPDFMTRAQDGGKAASTPCGCVVVKVLRY